MEKTKEELLEYIENLEKVIDNLPFDVWMKDKDSKFIVVNKSIYGHSGLTREEVMGYDDHKVFNKELADIYIENDKKTMESGQKSHYEVEINGEIHEEFKMPFFDENGYPAGTLGFSRNINDEKIIVNELRKSEKRFRTIFEEAVLGIAIFNSKTGVATEMNNRFAEIIGRTKEEALSLKWQDYSHEDEIAEDEHLLQLLVDNKISNFSMNKRYIKPDGTYVWVNIKVATFSFSPFEEHYNICMVEDISDKKQAEEEVMYLSYYDQLTGLYNRRFYEEELKKIDREKNLPITLVLADVNGLKMTNDAFGHSVGDELLKTIAEIVKKEIRFNDMVARIGGDEFVILMPKTTSKEAQKVIERINNTISNQKWKHTICSVSFGFATKTKISEEIIKVFSKAEDMMYRNKLSESASTRNETLKIVAKTLYEKNKREQLHCERVSHFCGIIGKTLGLDSGVVNELKMAGLLHDIGKVGIDESLLNKKGKLTEKEWKDMKRHPQIGYHILRSVNEFAHIAEYVLYHHERVDGTGYPAKLKGNQIPLQSKILSIADAYDAMTSTRPYREKLTDDEIFREFNENAGKQFDFLLVKTLTEKINNNWLEKGRDILEDVPADLWKEML